MPLQSSGVITLVDIQTEFGGVNPIGINEYYSGGLYVPRNTIISGTGAPVYGAGGGAYPPTLYTGIQNASVDDASLQLPTLPFNFYINSTAYTAVFIGSNSYITFGSGSSNYSGLSASNPPFPKMMFGAADNSYQRVSTVTIGTNFVGVRYEGNGSPSGTVGSPGIVAEITLFNPSIMSGLNVIEMRIGNHNRTDGVSNFSNASTAYITYTIQANQSYVFIGNSTGTSWTLRTGFTVSQLLGIPISGAISLNNFYGQSSILGVPVPTSAVVTPNFSNQNEGNSVTFTVNTTNFASGTLYWTLNTISGTVNGSDFTDGAVSGSFTITSSTGSVVRTLTTDLTTEGSESFQLQVRTGSTSGTVIGTSSTVTINDTSTSAPSATVAPNFTTVNEGSTVTFTVNTTNFASGTLYWSILTSNMNTSDFTDGAVSGSFTITSSAGSVARTLTNDVTTEGSESFQLQVRTGSAVGTIIGTSPTVTINDTSVAAFSWSTNVMGYSDGNYYSNYSQYYGNVVTPGAGNSPVTFSITMQAQDGDGTLELYVGGSLVQIWTKSSSPTNTVYSYTSTFGASSLYFVSELNDYGMGDASFSQNIVRVGATIVFMHTQNWVQLD